MIQVERLTKRYGSRLAVRDVSFHVDKGEIVGFLGPNGAGKSTTLRVITGFLAPTAGRVLVDGIDAHGTSLEPRRRVGYMPEGVPMYPEMRVGEYLRYRAELKGVERRAIAGDVGRCLEQAAVADVEGRIVGQLSKGYRQRVGLADALLGDPPILILDEPSAGLDPNQIRQMRALIRSFRGDKTVFLSTHILPEVEATCDRVVIIREGAKVGEGDPRRLRADAEGDRTLRVASGSEVSALEGVLSGVEGVREVSPHPEVMAGEGTRLRLRIDADPEVPERVFRAVAEAGLSLRELTLESASLEDVFAELTTIEGTDAEAATETPQDPVAGPDAGAGDA